MKDDAGPPEARATPLAAFLAREKEALFRLFPQRLSALVPGRHSRSELGDHLPDFLEELIDALRGNGRPLSRLLARSTTAQEHGQQRLRVGFDLDSLVREYGLLRDCIFELLEERGCSPPLHELRLLSDSISAATADAVTVYVGEREARLEAQTQHLLGLLEQAPGFICFLRGNPLRFELVNAAYLQLVGHRDIVGKLVEEALPEVVGQGFLELLDQVVRTGEPYLGRGVRIALQRVPGAPLEEAFIDFIYQPIRDRDGQVAGLLAQGHDVTEVHRQEALREQAEAAMRASELRYRTLFESIDDGYCLLEMIFNDAGQPCDYRFLETNAAFERQTGLTGATGHTARELVPTLDASWFRLYGQVATTREPVRFENHAPAMGRWFDVYASPVGGPSSRQVALVFKDITDRKRGEQEREELLQRESAARRDAEQASRLKDEFLATVSHELKTPLTSMLGWVQMLRHDRLGPEKRERALETIERNARAQAQLIEDLLDVSRILAGKLRLEVGSVDMQSVVSEAVETVRPAAEARHLTLELRFLSNGTVMGDAQRLQQVVWNLLSNAVKFTPPGGRVEVRLERTASSAELFVEDTGQGIDPAFQPYVFERFRQADGGTTRLHGGLGLGLSIVRQLVELHGGTVSVESDGVGRGARFSVRLPLAVVRRRDALEPELLRPPFGSPPELAGLKALVVDDEADTRELLRTLLEACGVEVTLASSAAECLALLDAAAPEVLISDIGMPGEDGYSLIEKVRARGAEGGGRLPAVALTALGRSEDRTRAILAGFTHHVPKPIEPLELFAVLAAVAGRSAAQHG